MMDLYDAYDRRIDRATLHPKATIESGQKKEHSDPDQNQATNNPGRPPKRSVDHDSPVDTQNDQAKPYEEKQYRLQRRGLVVQVLLCIFTALAFAAAAYYAHVADLQLDLSRGQLGIMQRQMEVAERPWLSVKVSITGPLDCTLEVGCMVTVRLLLSNLGHAPAVGSKNRMTLAANNEYQPERFKALLGIQEQECGNGPLPETAVFLLFEEPPPQPTTVFPNERVRVEKRLGISQTDISNVMAFNGQHFIRDLAVVGCVDYSPGFGTQLYQTGVLYTLTIQRPNSKAESLIEPITSLLILAEALRLQEVPGGNYAH